MATSKTTTDHTAIRKWAEERGGRPAIVKSTEREGGGLLRIDFQEPEAELEQVSWEKFFDIFDSRHLAFLYQDKTADGKTSRFFKFVDQ